MTKIYLIIEYDGDADYDGHIIKGSSLNLDVAKEMVKKIILKKYPNMDFEISTYKFNDNCIIRWSNINCDKQAFYQFAIFETEDGQIYDKVEYKLNINKKNKNKNKNKNKK